MFMQMMASAARIARNLLYSYKRHPRCVHGLVRRKCSRALQARFRRTECPPGRMLREEPLVIHIFLSVAGATRKKLYGVQIAHS
jgi:hypothetical protein